MDGLRGPNYQFTKEYLTPTEKQKELLKNIGKRYQELMEDNMKELKRGDFVWSKRYGNGLVYSAYNSGDDILFENRENIITLARSDLFAKGDEVEATEWWGLKELVGTFIGVTDDPDRTGKLIIKTDSYIEEDNKFLLEYANNIKHKPIDKLEVILTMNGKEIDAKNISKETWDNLRSLK